MTADTGVRAVARREWRRVRQGRLYGALLLGFPLASILCLVALFGSAVPMELPVAVCDQDHSALSRRLIRDLDATRALRVAQRLEDPREGIALYRRGLTYAVVTIPAGTQRRLLRGEDADIAASTNGQWLLVESTVRTELQRVVATLSAGVEFRRREGRGERAPAALTRLEPIRAERHILFNPNLNYAHYLLPALLPTMLQIFILLTAVLAVGAELRDGTAGDWLAAAGGSPWRAVAGKLGPHALWFTGLGLGVLTLLFGPLGVPQRGSALVLVAGTLLFTLAYLAVGLALAAWTANLRLATSLGSFYAGPAFAFTGITYPTLDMPALGRIWSDLLPLSHYLRLLVDQALRGAPADVAAGPLAALAAFALLAAAVSIRRVGRLAADPTAWGRV